MFIDVLNNLAGEAVLNFPEKLNVGQGFALALEGNEVIKVTENGSETAILPSNLLLAYVNPLDAVPFEIVKTGVSDETADALNLTEERSNEFYVGYDMATQTYYLQEMDSAISLNAYYQTTAEVEGLPAGSFLFDYEEEITPEHPLRAYAQDGIRRTFPQGTYQEIA